ncbi:hypothetical protein PCH_Pc22g06000 [Penicillium rubens Wisconsin 54-1255]|uniref:Uncharacterized protein n=1 Tax=Penicillium rubens (strain ATCC 28089 / DSM 1075 / NRRL 1951 / Wisconsin 54-1255) TaxID=500485 RepID=B6HVI8_PENRW|nr:hypothetical protein PCH_Pc22g06000 [Penicillium rubens Wisconsin 54-1255]
MRKESSGAWAFREPRGTRRREWWVRVLYWYCIGTYWYDIAEYAMDRSRRSTGIPVPGDCTANYAANPLLEILDEKTPAAPVIGPFLFHLSICAGESDYPYPVQTSYCIQHNLQNTPGTLMSRVSRVYDTGNGCVYKPFVRRYPGWIKMPGVGVSLDYAGTGNGGGMLWLDRGIGAVYYVLPFWALFSFSLRRKSGCRRDRHMANGILTEVGWEGIGLLRYCPPTPG